MTLYGWDLSHYDGPDARRAIDEGFTFFTHKAGGDAIDAELDDWWNLMKGYRDRVMLGAYWVLYPGSPVARADAFLARLDAACSGWRDRPFILQADCEKWGGDPGTVPGRAEIEAFCDRLKTRMPKLTPIVYGPKWVYGNSLAGLSYPLWASSYVGGSGVASKLYPGDGASGWNAYSGQTPLILQFSSSATIAGQTTCDANAFRGTLTQLQTKLAPGWATENGVDEMSAQDVYDAWKLAADASAPGRPDPMTPFGHQMRDNVNAVIDFSTLPMSNAITALTALVIAQSPATAAEIAAALAPLINAKIGGASPAEVETIIRRVFGTLDA